MEIREEHTSTDAGADAPAPRRALAMETSEYRPLTPSERDLIVWMLEHGPDGATNFIPQLDDLIARSSCSCGCPSIEFSVPLESPYIPQPLGFRICCSGNSDGYDVGLMLTAGSGVLSQLDVYTFGEIDHPFNLPSLRTLDMAR
jgi:hypothetical protein